MKFCKYLYRLCACRFWQYVARPRLVNVLVAGLLCFGAGSVTGPAPGYAAGFAAARDGGAFKLFILGDSIMAGYGVAAGKSIPVQLYAALLGRGYAVRVVNGGVSGDTSAGGKARLDWVLRDRPDGVIVALGANDALRGLSPAATKRNLSAILDRLAAAKVPVLLVGMKAPRNLGTDYVSTFDAIFPALAREFRVMFYPFLLEGVALKPELNQRDGIHPNAKGVAHIVGQMVPLVEKFLIVSGGNAARRAR